MMIYISQDYIVLTFFIVIMYAMQSVGENRDVDQRSKQCRTSLIFTTIALVFGLVVFVIAVVIAVIRTKEQSEDNNDY